MAAPLPRESEDLLALTAFVANASRGLPVAVTKALRRKERSRRGIARRRNASAPHVSKGVLQRCGDTCGPASAGLDASRQAEA